MGGGGGGGGAVVVLGRGLWKRAWAAESKALSNVRVQGQDCRVSTCSPPGPTAQAIINPLSGATACHYSLTCIHTHVCTQPHEHPHSGTRTYSHTQTL